MAVHPLAELISQLSMMPGVGPKSAQRLSFFFLSLPQETVNQFAQTLVHTRQSVKYCKRCFNLALSDFCTICEDLTRQPTQLCVVAEPKDIMALERSHDFKGIYHVLGGVLSPIDGIHAEALRISELITRLKSEPIQEIILAINPTLEGEATLLYLSHVLSFFDGPITKLAYGLPVGADMDYADDMTLKRAFMGRTQVEKG